MVRPVNEVARARGPGHRFMSPGNPVRAPKGSIKKCIREESIGSRFRDLKDHDPIRSSTGIEFLPRLYLRLDRLGNLDGFWERLEADPFLSN